MGRLRGVWTGNLYFRTLPSINGEEYDTSTYIVGMGGARIVFDAWVGIILGH